MDDPRNHSFLREHANPFNQPSHLYDPKQRYQKENVQA
jgi:hypothetical protein